METESYRRGAETLTKLNPHAVENLVASLANIAPDLARFIIEFPYGQIYSRPQLDLKSRELATVAALTALGNAAPQLRAHITYALNAGCTQQEIVEVMMQMAFYGGFPNAMNALWLAEELFAERAAHASESQPEPPTSS
ncbi:MAG TPA: carboxymuconolactone decarboxylase family protein [Candidatus Baltobacteraceae bacterium]|jgi:4-carboxymuconolactone decarboxylase|nr:carboxymuconolactone decarboxylase family protein [Candidatus Baltobacteraceae bacterium]